ncbi:A/G-specific adenine glycosylase [Demequina sp.]|uniref:A/G-specific adenine glycosylase n=1 Tax=Demequina sp. TaxID=2050685 RepID=UPI003D101AE2
MPRESPDDAVVNDVLEWYAREGRDLPWRDGRATPWGVLVSEVMLQQTPVARVEPVWREWMERWPTPSALAGSSQADAVRAWGRLGYPRRAARLWECARVLVERHAGEVPQTREELLSLPGVGDYTSAAVMSFAYGGRAAVLDTNVKRVFARIWEGEQFPPPGVTAAERALAERVLPAEPSRASEWAVASMELGALVCTARAPKCDACPVCAHCAWRAAGYPASGLVAKPSQAWHGTDRQVRGRILAQLRDALGPVPLTAIEGVDGEQFERALASLLADGLVTEAGNGTYAL